MTMRKRQQELYTARDELAPLAVRLAAALHRAGLHKTGHKMHEVVVSLGWEIAEELEAS